MANEVDFTKLYSQLNQVLGNTDLSDVSAESSGFSELPEGYYLCEVEKSELKTSKSSGMPMAAFQFKICEDGIDVQVDEKNDIHLSQIKGSKNRKIFKYYTLKDETSVRRFVTDMLKFEGDNEGESLLPKEAFMTAETLADALDVLIGLRVYVQVSITTNDKDENSTWYNLISWKRAKALELPL